MQAVCLVLIDLGESGLATFWRSFIIKAYRLPSGSQRIFS